MRRLLPSLALLASLWAASAQAAAPVLLYTCSAGSGTTLADTSTGTALTATITPGASGAWTTAGTNRVGYDFAGTGTSVTATLASTKVNTALAGLQKVTLEVVIDSAASTSTYDSYFVVSDGSSVGLVGIVVNHGAGGLFADAGDGNSPNAGNIRYAIPTSGVLVIHLVVDSTQATAANRFLIYVNGAVVTPTIIDQIGLNVALDTGFNWSTATVKMGESGASARKLYYAALYATALTSGQVSANATALAVNNDADPNGAVAVPDNALFMFSDASWRWAPPHCVSVGTGTRLAIEVQDAPLLRYALPQAVGPGVVACRL